VKRIFGVLMLLGLALSYASAAPEQIGTGTVDRRMTADEQLSLRLINAERTERDLLPLRFDPVLMKVARSHSRDMAERSYFAHISPPPDETNPFERYENALGRKFRAVVGENVGRAEQPLMGQIHASLMESPEHRANILDVEYTRVGVGVFTFPDGHVWITQMFRGEEEPTH